MIEIFCDVSVSLISAQLGDDGELWALAASINKEFIDLLYMGPWVAETKYFCTDDGSHRAELFAHASWLVDTWVEVQQKLNPAVTENHLHCTDTVYTRSCFQMVQLMRRQFLKGRPSKGVDLPEIKNGDHRDSRTAMLGFEPVTVSLAMLKNAAIDLLEDWKGLATDLERQKKNHFRDCKRSK